MNKLLGLLLTFFVVNSAFAGDAGGLKWGYPAHGYAQSTNFVYSTNMGDLNSRAAQCMPAIFDASSETMTTAGVTVAFTGTPATDSYQVRVETADSTGTPSGTVLGSTTTNFTPSGSGSGQQIEVTLSNSLAVNRGDSICIVIERIATTDAANKIEIGYRMSTIGVLNTLSTPYTALYAASTWTKYDSFGGFYLRNSGRTAYIGFPRFGGQDQRTVGNTEEGGMFFTIPSNYCSTFKLKGVTITGTMPAATDTYHIRLYSNGTGTPSVVQETGSLTPGALYNYAGSSDGRTFLLPFPSTTTLQTLNCGTEYVLAYSTTSTRNIKIMRVNNVDDWNAYPYKTMTSLAYRLNASYPPASSSVSFTKTTTSKPLMDLIISDVTAPTGGGNTFTGIMRMR